MQIYYLGLLLHPSVSHPRLAAQFQMISPGLSSNTLSQFYLDEHVSALHMSTEASPVPEMMPLVKV